MKKARIVYILDYQDPKNKKEGYFAKITCNKCNKESRIFLGKEWDEKYNFLVQNMVRTCENL